MLALIPFLALSSALGPLSPIIAGNLHMSLQEMSLSTGMANAGYATGTLLAVVLAQHLPQRRMLIVYATMLVVGSLRPLFWVIVAIAAGALLMSILTFEDSPAEDRDAPKDPLAIMLAVIGCSATFFGASELLTHPFLNGETAAPLVGGLGVIIIMIVYEFRAKRPLLIIRQMLTSTMPVASMVIALGAATASVSATALSAEALAPHYRPLHVGLLYAPEVGGAIISAFTFGAVLRSRTLHYLPWVGMLFLAAGIAVFRIKVPSSEAATLIGAGLTGVGLGATVAPALFVVGFSVPAPGLARVFAVIELLRGAVLAVGIYALGGVGAQSAANSLTELTEATDTTPSMLSSSAYGNRTTSASSPAIHGPSTPRQPPR